MDWSGFIRGRRLLLYLLWIGVSCGDSDILVLVIVGLTIGSVICGPGLVVLVCFLPECRMLFCGPVELLGSGITSGHCGVWLGRCVGSVFVRVTSVISM